jgi:hypothetical protein
MHGSFSSTIGLSCFYNIINDKNLLALHFFLSRIAGKKLVEFCFLKDKLYNRTQGKKRCEEMWMRETWNKRLGTFYLYWINTFILCYLHF